MRGHRTTPFEHASTDIDQGQGDQRSGHVGSVRTLEEDPIDDPGEHDRAANHTNGRGKSEGNRHPQVPTNPFGYPEEAPVDRANPVCFCAYGVRWWAR